MSRRRTKPPPPAVPGAKVIRVVCTDRGQHPEVLFRKVDVWPDDSVPGGWFVEPPSDDDDDFYRPPPGVRDYISQTPADATGPTWEPITYDPFKCSRCGRNVPLKRETLISACTKLAARGESPLDVSYIG